jgi:hypothetical protein
MCITQNLITTYYPKYIYMQCELKIMYLPEIGWRKLHNEEFGNLCPLPDIMRTVNSRDMAHMGEKCTQYFGRKTRRNVHVSGRIIFK